MTVVAAVLAAGAGSRFRGDEHKLLVPFRGRPLVRWAVEAAAAGVGDVLVVWGAVDLADALQGTPARLVRNERWDEGLATSLQVAVCEARRRGNEGVVVGLGDQPLVTASAWEAVAAAVAAGAAVAVATYAGRRRNPVGLGRGVWPFLPETGDEGARSLLAGRPDLVREVACEGEPADVDTMEDLGRWS